MDDAIDGVDASQIPEDDVSSLMQEVLARNRPSPELIVQILTLTLM